MRQNIITTTLWEQHSLALPEKLGHPDEINLSSQQLLNKKWSNNYFVHNKTQLPPDIFYHDCMWFPSICWPKYSGYLWDQKFPGVSTIVQTGVYVCEKEYSWAFCLSCSYGCPSWSSDVMLLNPLGNGLSTTQQNPCIRNTHWVLSRCHYITLSGKGCTA